MEIMNIMSYLKAKFRKKVLNPIEWTLEEVKEVTSVTYPNALTLVELRRELIEKMNKHHRRGDNEERARLEGRIEMLNWLLTYGE